MASAWFHNSLAFVGLYSRYSCPSMVPEYPGTFGEVKESAGVPRLLSTFLQMLLRSMAMDSALRRSCPSSVEVCQCSSCDGMVMVCSTEPALLYASTDESVWKILASADGMVSSTSRLPACTSA